jgi:hypothetical protein
MNNREYSMRQTVTCRNVVLFAVLFMLLSAGAGAAREGTPLQQTIDYLLDYVSQSGLTFRRNGKSYSAPEAAGHMRRKYEHFRDDIGSAEDFIRLSATRSLVSGNLYTLVDEDGRELTTGEWLTRVLFEYRSSTAAAVQ